MKGDAEGEESEARTISSTSVAEVSSKEVHRLASFLAQAFEWDPMQIWLFPRDDQRKSQIAEVMARDIAYRVDPSTRVLSAPGGQSVVFVEQREGPVRSARAWRIAPAFLSLIGPRAVHGWRLLRRLDAAHASVGSHLYVMHLAVAPAERGRGIASSLLARIANDADSLGFGVYLETASPEAVALYGRHGFEVQDVIRQGPAPPVWILWRRPTDTGSR